MAEWSDKNIKNPKTSLSLSGVLGDEEIVAAVCGGDKNKYAEIIRRYQSKLLRYAASVLGDDEKAADAVQEAFIKAYVNLNSFNQKKKFSSWLYRITHNEAINQINKHDRHQIKDTDWEPESQVNLEDDYVRSKLIAEAQNCLTDMPLIYREPISLYFLDDKSYEEISDILKLPIGTVGTRINRGKLMLKKICQNKK